MNINEMKARAAANGYTVFPFIKPAKSPKYWCAVRLNDQADKTNIHVVSGTSAEDAENKAWEWAGTHGRKVTSMGSAAQELAKLEREHAEAMAELKAIRAGKTPEPEPESKNESKPGDLASAKLAKKRATTGKQTQSN